MVACRTVGAGLYALAIKVVSEIPYQRLQAAGCVVVACKFELRPEALLNTISAACYDPMAVVLVRFG